MNRYSLTTMLRPFIISLLLTTSTSYSMESLLWSTELPFCGLVWSAVATGSLACIEGIIQGCKKPLPYFIRQVEKESQELKFKEHKNKMEELAKQLTLLKNKQTWLEGEEDKRLGKQFRQIQKERLPLPPNKVDTLVIQFSDNNPDNIPLLTLEAMV